MCRGYSPLEHDFRLVPAFVVYSQQSICLHRSTAASWHKPRSKMGLAQHVLY